MTYFLSNGPIMWVTVSNVEHPCDMSVKSNFTLDLIFLILKDSEINWFPFFFVQNLKWQPSKNDQ